uniref:G_PROTEIN_RECEP_F1_2 domain-containing protein n=1 Tax=Angiostrongylus costaricensis TaxID=334426 RepID=A0A158PI17_ANGCS
LVELNCDIKSFRLLRCYVFYRARQREVRRCEKLGSKFILVSFINCLVVLFCVAFSTGWTSRLAPVIGLIFNLACLVFIGGAITTLFVWKLNEMSLPKRCIFMLVFMMLSIITGVMFAVAPTICDSFSKYGCFESYYSPALKVAAVCYIYLNSFTNPLYS